MKRRLKWNRDLAVGVAIIDEQHKMLFDLAGDLQSAVKSGASRQTVDALFSMMLSYSFRHFEMEEGLLKDEDEYTRQCCRHYALLRQLHDYAVSFRNQRAVEADPADFLDKWLRAHIDDCAALAWTFDQEMLVVDEDAKEQEEGGERRLHKRIRHDRILDEAIIGYCHNASTKKAGLVTIVDLAGGGLKIRSKQKIAIDDLLIISCRVGKSFKLQEKARAKSAREDLYGVEFVSPSDETVKFLTELCGAVHRYS